MGGGEGLGGGEVRLLLVKCRRGGVRLLLVVCVCRGGCNTYSQSVWGGGGYDTYS